MKFDKSKLKIRKATKKDIDIIVMLQQELADYHHKLDPKYWSGANPAFAKSFKENVLKKKIGKRSSYILLIEFDKKPIGYFLAFYTKAPPALKYKTMGHMSDGYVRKEFRGSGIGRMAMDRIMVWFKQSGIQIAELGVDIQNEVGKKAWKKMGFKEYVLKMKKIIK